MLHLQMMVNMSMMNQMRLIRVIMIVILVRRGMMGMRVMMHAGVVRRLRRSAARRWQRSSGS